MALGPAIPWAMNMQIRNLWIIQQKDILLSSSNGFLIATKRYIKKNGHEELEGLIISKKEDILLSRSDGFLIAAERYIKENGHEEL
ncbi:hypothetical protein HHK36_025488 [Tetracentron sinense]|uniref:Uncharacterized protein n=1 Tax=Tetracentron sinense TaxID=13715 RepID=A0A834YL92_TETSI|nr:hypothetical protein HHK36_025488 [Tetracentron sinense]